MRCAHSRGFALIRSLPTSSTATGFAPDEATSGPASESLRSAVTTRSRSTPRNEESEEGWLNLTEAARLVGVSARTLRLAVEHGELQREHPLPDGPWIFHRD